MRAVGFLNYRAGSSLFQLLCGCPPPHILGKPNVGGEPSGFLPSVPPVFCSHIDPPSLRREIERLSSEYESFFLLTHVGNWWGELPSDQVPMPYEDPSEMKWSFRELESLDSIDQFIYLIRDGRGQLDSLRNLCGGIEEQHNLKSREDYFRALALGFRNRARIALDAQDYMGDRFRIVRFEDLLSNPSVFMSDLLSFLSLSVNQDLLSKRISLGNTGVAKAHSSFSDNYRQGRWNSWPREEKEFFSTVADLEMKELGYV